MKPRTATGPGVDRVMVRRVLALPIAWVLSVGTAAVTADDLGRQVRAFRQSHEKAIVGQLDELTRLSSIAADPGGLAATADRLAALLGERGLKTQLLSAGNAAPSVVFGELRSPGATRTVVYYAHYDGQPITPSQWASAPFEPVMRSGPLGPSAMAVDWRAAPMPLDPEWRLFGRAVSDDKASIVALLAALDALAASGRKPSVNVKVFWEGEEESGSPHLKQILEQNAALLNADLWLIGDGPVNQARRMQLYFGARGVSGVEMTVYGPVRALHDGHYGNWVPNPAFMAAELIAGMRSSDGLVLISGFDDGARPLTAAEHAAIAALPAVEGDLKREFAIGRTEGSEGLIDSLMRPALNVRGLRSGHVGAEAANAIPVDATISIDIRSVPGQTPTEIRQSVEAHLRAKGWTVIDAEPDPAQRLSSPKLVRLAWEPGYPAERTDMALPVSKAVILAAGRGAGQPVLVLPMMGASVPMYLFADLLHTPVIGLPIVNHDNNQHAANENLRLQNLWDGIQVYAELLADLRW